MNEEVDPMRHQQQPKMSSSRSTLPAALVEQLLNSMDVRIEAFAICRLGLNSALAIPAAPELKILYVLTVTLVLDRTSCLSGDSVSVRVAPDARGLTTTNNNMCTILQTT